MKNLVVCALCLLSASSAHALSQSAQEHPYTMRSDVVVFETAPLYVYGYYPPRRTLAPAARGFSPPAISEVAPGNVQVLIAADKRVARGNHHTNHEPSAILACMVPRVYFALNSARVDPQEIEQVIGALKRCGAKAAAVRGFTCELGAQLYNDRLALARARNVAKVLENRGVQLEQVEGRGKSDYVTTAPEKRDKNRRVEVSPL